jgi:putative two-component system response regulator
MAGGAKDHLNDRPHARRIAPDLTDARILVVDDQSANVRLLESLLARWGFMSVTTTTDSSCTRTLYEQVRPDLLLLDLQMPAPDGFEVMELLVDEIRGETRLPVLVLTADISPEVRQRALASGARDFLTKPFDPNEVYLRLRNLLETRRLQLELQGQNETLEQRVRARTRDLEMARRDTLERLARAAEYRDHDTYEHAQRVGRTAALLLAELGAPAAEVELIQRAAPLHDIGKIGIPDSILLKPGPLGDDEYETIKTHTVVGHALLGGSDSRVLQPTSGIASPASRSGYPSPSQRSW